MIRDRGARADRPHRSRRWRARAALAAGGVAIAGVALVNAAEADPKAEQIERDKPPVLSLDDALMHDAASPVVGNPDGDVTIVAFVDYNCPYCKKSEAGLAALVAGDPKIRIIYKDFPILTKTSLSAAKIAIAAKYQGKYAEVHTALMHMSARPASDADIGRAIVASGADVPRLNKDLDRHNREIGALLQRNIAEADALQLKGTPVYLIGPYIAQSPLDLPQFKKIVADAREDQAKPSADRQD